MNVVKFTEQMIQRQPNCLCDKDLNILFTYALFSIKIHIVPTLLIHHTLHQHYLTESGGFMPHICIVMII